MLYALHLHKDVCQWFLDKTGKEAKAKVMICEMEGNVPVPPRQHHHDVDGETDDDSKSRKR